MESKKQNKQVEQKQAHRYKEHFDVCQMKRRLEGWVKRAKGLRSTNWYSQNSHGDVKYSTRNIGNNIVINTYGVGWVLALSG